MKRYLVKNALLLLVILISIFSKGQNYNFTVVPFIDANNNCNYDAGETMVQQTLFHPFVLSNGLRPYSIANNCYMVPSSSTVTGIQSAPSPFITLDDEMLPYLQPCFINSLSLNSVIYLPFIPTFDSFWHLLQVPTVSRYQSATAFGAATSAITNQDSYTTNICTSDNNLWISTLFGNPWGQCQTGTLTTPYSASLIVKVDGNVLDRCAS